MLTTSYKKLYSLRIIKLVILERLFYPKLFPITSFFIYTYRLTLLVKFKLIHGMRIHKKLEKYFVFM